MSLPFTSLDAVTSPGSGLVRDLEKSIRRHTAFATVTGGPSGVEMYLEGSHDGVNWRRLNGLSSPSSSTTVETHHVRYVRANLITLTGGTSPTVTVTIASGDE